MLKDAPFYEYEIARRTERFGNIATVFSACEAQAARKAPVILKRGMNMIWDDEREGLALPADLSRRRKPDRDSAAAISASYARAASSPWLG